MKFLSYIAFKCGADGWIKTGTLFFDKDAQKAYINLWLLHQGMLVAKPHDGDPFIEGDLIYNEVKVGYMTSTLNKKGEELYSIHLLAFPIGIASDVWLEVRELDGLAMPIIT